MKPMRITVSLDDYVTVLLRQVHRQIQQLLKAPDPRPPFRTRSFNLGRCYLPDLNNTSEVLAIAEGGNYK
jgi:hypothetical protein